MTCQDFIDYVDSLLPNSSEDTRSKASCMLMHMITLMRSFDKVELQKVRSSTGKTFTAEIMRRDPIVSKLARALNIKAESLYKPKSIPDHLKRWACELGVDTAEVQTRHERLESAVNEICVQALFVQVARTVMQNLHEDTLRDMDRSYHGHCHPSYIPKNWIFGKEDRSLLGLRASQLPGAHAPRAVAHRPIVSFSSLAPTARNTVHATRRATAPAPGVTPASKPARRTAHPYARPVPAARQPASSALYADVSRAPRRTAQRSMYPAHIPTQHQYEAWHQANTPYAPHPGFAY